MGFRLVQKRKGALQTRICGSLQHPNRRTNNYHHEQGFGHDQNKKQKQKTKTKNKNKNKNKNKKQKQKTKTKKKMNLPDTIVTLTGVACDNM